jgi:hypothetical protein
MDLKRELIKTSNTVRKKYLALKRGIADEEDIIKKKFKPIVEPIAEIVKNIKNKNKKGIRKKKLSISKPISDDNINDEMTLIQEENDPQSESPQIMSDKDQFTHDLDSNGNNAVNFDGDDDEEGDEDEEEDDGDGNVGDNDSSFDDYIRKSVEDVNREMDHTYGVYVGPDGSWMIGNSNINYVPSENIIKIKNSRFKATRGLLELIFKKKPVKSLITQNDLEAYKDILTLTSAHLVRHTDGERIQVTNTIKYKSYIKKLFKRGGGINISHSPFMKLNTYPCAPDYVHYDDINKIVDRLRILKASEAAGNTSHNNEIISIITELREKGVIY